MSRSAGGCSRPDIGSAVSGGALAGSPDQDTSRSHQSSRADRTSRAATAAPADKTDTGRTQTGLAPARGDDVSGGRG